MLRPAAAGPQTYLIRRRDGAEPDWRRISALKRKKTFFVVVLKSRMNYLIF